MKSKLNFRSLSLVGAFSLNLAIVSLAFSQADPTQVTDRQLSAWEIAASEVELHEFLDQVNGPSMPDWPSCFSANYEWRSEDLTQLHSRCREIAKSIVMMLVNATESPSEYSWDQLRRLINFRDEVLDAGAYVSYVLADAINIYSYHEFVRVLRETWDGKSAREIHDRLANRTATTEDFMELLMLETGRDIEDIARDFVEQSIRESIETGKAKSKELEAYPFVIDAALFYTVHHLSGEGNNALPVNLKEAMDNMIFAGNRTDEGYIFDSIVMLNERNIPFLMRRRWDWDFFITSPSIAFLKFVEANKIKPSDFTYDSIEELSEKVELPDEIVTKLRLYRFGRDLGVYRLLTDSRGAAVVKFLLSAN